MTPYVLRGTKAFETPEKQQGLLPAVKDRKSGDVYSPILLMSISRIGVAFSPQTRPLQTPIKLRRPDIQNTPLHLPCCRCERLCIETTRQH
jgi:hypothetical protein